MRSIGTITLGAILAAALLLAGCAQQPRATGPTPDGYVVMHIGIEGGQLSTAGLEAQGAPYTTAGTAAVGLVNVSVFDKHDQLVKFAATGSGYVADRAGTLTEVPLTSAAESATLTLVAADNPYRFVAHGYRQQASQSVIAYDAQTKLVGDGTTVRIALTSVLGGAQLVPRYPANYVSPGPAPFELLLVVTANGYSTFPGTDYLQVPLGDFTVEYGAVSGATVQEATKRGMRLLVDDCQVGVGQGVIRGLVWNGTEVEQGEIALPAYGVGCQTAGGNIDVDLQAPTVSITYDANTLTITGQAQDANDRISKVQVWDGAKLLASTDQAEESSAVAYFQFDLGLSSFTVTLKSQPVGGLVALAFDPAGNEGRSAETFNQLNVWVDANAAANGDGTEAQPFLTIDDGVSAVAVGGTVWVRPGTYDENVVVDKNLRLLSTAGRESTSIVGLQGGSELGTVQVTSHTTGVQLGDIGHGFHIVGLDGPAGLEKAAVYFQGSHDDPAVIGNEIEAGGDAGLTTEAGAAVQRLVVSHNLFSGQTFTGAHPAGEGFGSQFTLPNVPRQLVVVSNGATYASFTHNIVTGTAGGLNDLGAPQGNTLITVDAVGSLIANNHFEGYTTRYATSLRARGAGTTISDNAFVSAGLPDSAGHLYLANNALDAALVAANTFDRGVWVADTAGGTVGLALPATFSPSMSGTVVNLLPGEYDVGGHVLVNAAGLTLRGPNAAAPQGTQRGPEAVIKGGVALAAPDVTVTGIAFEGFGAYLGDVSALYLADGATNAKISNNVVEGSGSGRGVVSALGAAADARITGNSFQYLTSGVFAQGLAAFWVEGNLFANNAAGSANDAGGQTVVGNTFRDNEEGVGLGAPGVTVNGNYFGQGHDSYVTVYTPGSYVLADLITANTFESAAVAGSYTPGWTSTAFPAVVP